MATFEFLLYAIDESALPNPASVAVLASRLKLFDAIAYNPGGWAWGQQELADPAFRIMSIAAESTDICDTLLAPLRQTYNANNLTVPLTYLQPRMNFLNLLDPRVAQNSPDAVTWWADATRTAPIYYVPADYPLEISDLITAHAAVNVPT